MNNTNSQIDQSSVFLVSGGAKGITAQCVIELAKHKKCKFILLGRSSILEPEPIWARGCSSESELKQRIMEELVLQAEKPTPVMVQKEFNAISSRREIQKTLSTIEQAGGQAEYLSVDVTDVLALEEKLRAAVGRTGAVTGIIHGAGNLADKPLEKKSEQDFETIYNVLVKGLENLLSCVSVSKLDYLVLFSSVVGFYGNVGQSDYAIASEILNKSAYLVKRHQPNCHVVAINWGPWDSGMVSPELKKAFADRNIETIPIKTGTKMLVDELDTANQETVQVVIGSPLVPTTEVLNSKLQTFRIHRILTLADNPFLEDNLLGERSFLPATCALSWMINTCEQLYPGYHFFSSTNFKVLKVIIFDETLANEYILEIKEIAKHKSSAIEFGCKIWSKTKGGKIRYHFSTQLKLIRQIPVAPTYDSFNSALEQKNIADKISFYQNGKSKFTHGYCFQGVENILNISQKKLTLQCVLPSVTERQQGQFTVQTVNPYIANVQLHSTWIWLQHFYQQCCLTSEIKQFQQFAKIPFGEIFYISCEVNYKTETCVVADIIAHNLDGKVYTHMLRAKETILSLKQSQR